jgi:phenylalanyl-tRNA synthetase beta chain
MQFPESWLREFCNPPLSTQELADLLTMSGMEVEELRPVAPPFSGVVVAEILTAEPHPQADRLRVCRSTPAAAADGPLQIVCGAPNARAGIRVPLAWWAPSCRRVPTASPSRSASASCAAWKAAACCARRASWASEDHGGLLELADDAPVGQDIREHLRSTTPLHAQAHAQPGALPERLRHRARGLGLTGAPLHVPPSSRCVPACRRQRLPVRCRRPTCAAASPAASCAASTRRRTDAGLDGRPPGALRPALSVTALVDISNYVMFEYGRPSHIFDLDKIHGELVVRWGRAGETLKLLNGNTVEVDEQVGVIADEPGPGRIAGRHHGRRRHRGVRRHAQRLRRGRLLVARRGGRAFAPLQLLHRRRAPLRARRRPGADGGEHIERITQLIQSTSAAARPARWTTS